MRFGIALTKIAAIAACGAVVAWAADAPIKGTAPAEPEAAPMPVKNVPTLGKLETAKWTPTTYESATAEANKKVLAGGKPATVTGEIVDVSCYLQLGKRGDAHIPCGTKCIMNGQPIGIVDAKTEDLYILFAEEHHPRRDGQVDLKKVFVPLLAKTATVTGMMTAMKGYKALFVQAAELTGASVMAPPPVPAPATPDSAAKK
jgi:hypothetical protein